MNMPTRLALLAVLSALTACGQKTEVSSTGSAATVAEATPMADQSESAVAPAIIPPDEVANPTEPPSYEVAIASAAATRNQALNRCAKQPEAVRTQCEQEANTAYADAERDLQSLRGNQE